MKLKFPYLIPKPRTDGSVSYYWQPNKALRDAGFKLRVLGKNLDVAAQQARQLNAEVDAWRGGQSTEDVRGRALVGTVRHLIEHFRTSPEYLNCGVGSRRVYDTSLRKIEAWAGDLTIPLVTAKRTKNFYQTLRKETPGAANNTLEMIRTLWKFAISEDMATSNPGKAVTMISTISRPVIWTPDAVAHGSVSEWPIFCRCRAASSATET